MRLVKSTNLSAENSLMIGQAMNSLDVQSLRFPKPPIEFATPQRFGVRPDRAQGEPLWHAPSTLVRAHLECISAAHHCCDSWSHRSCQYRGAKSSWLVDCSGSSR